MVAQTKFDWSFVGAIMLCFSEEDRGPENTEADFTTVVDYIQKEGILFPRSWDVHTFAKYSQAITAISKHGIKFTTLGEITADCIKTVVNPTEIFAPTDALKATPMYSGTWDDAIGYSPCTVVGYCEIIYGLINNTGTKPKRPRDTVRTLLHEASIKFPGNSTVIGAIFAGGGGKGELDTLIKSATSGPLLKNQLIPQQLQQQLQLQYQQQHQQQHQQQLYQQQLFNQQQQLYQQPYNQQHIDNKLNKSQRSHALQNSSSDEEEDPKRVAKSRNKLKKKVAVLRERIEKLIAETSVLKGENALLKHQQILLIQNHGRTPMDITMAASSVSSVSPASPLQMSLTPCTTPSTSSSSIPASQTNTSQPMSNIFKLKTTTSNIHKLISSEDSLPPIPMTQSSQTTDYFASPPPSVGEKEKDKEKENDKEKEKEKTDEFMSEEEEESDDDSEDKEEEDEEDSDGDKNYIPSTQRVSGTPPQKKRYELSWTQSISELPTNVSIYPKGRHNGTNPRMFTATRFAPSPLNLSGTLDENARLLNLKSYSILFTRKTDVRELCLLELYVNKDTHVHGWIDKESAPLTSKRYITHARKSRGKVIFLSESAFVDYTRDNEINFNIPSVNKNMDTPLTNLIRTVSGSLVTPKEQKINNSQ